MLEPDQQAAADKFMKFLVHPTENEMVITGFPGCGKSYLTKYLIEAARNSVKLLNMLADSDNKLNIFCTATTNKAAVVLQNFSGEEAKTIHSLLGLKVHNNTFTGETSLKETNDYRMLHNSLLIVDEASYVDTNLLAMIRKSTKDCKVLYVGDLYQLTAVKETSCPVFTDIAYTATLTGSKRFTKNGAISHMASRYRDTIDTGTFPKIIVDNKEIIRVTGPEFQAMVNDTFKDAYTNPVNSKILAWSNKVVQQYNKYIRNMHTDLEHFLVGERLVTNKPILGTQRSYGIATETIVEVTHINSLSTEHGVEGWWLQVDHSDRAIFQPRKQADVEALLKHHRKEKNWESFFLLKDFFSDLRSVHASTVHKSQGSTYDKVFLDLNNIGKCNQPTAVARLMHVAITRASDQVILYGDLPGKYRGIV